MRREQRVPRQKANSLEAPGIPRGGVGVQGCVWGENEAEAVD